MNKRKKILDAKYRKLMVRLYHSLLVYFASRNMTKNSTYGAWIAYWGPHSEELPETELSKFIDKQIELRLQTKARLRVLRTIRPKTQ